jgi:hypothetical protein
MVPAGLEAPDGSRDHGVLWALLSALIIGCRP